LEDVRPERRVLQAQQRVLSLPVPVVRAAREVHVALPERQAPLVLPLSRPEEQRVPRPSAVVGPELLRVRVVRALPVPACLAASAELSRPRQSKSNSSAFSFRLRQSQATGQ
jgi:hypothetical protein